MMATSTIGNFILLLLFLFDGAQSLARSGLANFGPAAMDSQLPTGDDQVAQIVLPLQFSYFGFSYTRLYVRYIYIPSLAKIITISCR